MYHAYILFTALALATSATAAQAQSVINRDVPATFVFSREVTVAPGYTYTWTTSNPSPGADPVLHLWDPTVVPGIGPGLHLGTDDDSGGGVNASLVFTSLWPTNKRLLLIMRAAVTGTEGTADITQTATPPFSPVNVSSTIADDAPVGGALVSVPTGVQTYETAMAPDGALDPRIFVLNADGELMALDDDGGVGLSARVTAVGASFVVVGTAAEGDAGPVHLYANDPLDFDFDGLGNGLEAALGTCGAPIAFGGTACAGVTNSRDTDLDGIVDGAEVFGVDDPEEPQYLSRWGADPRHKDVFVELDFRADLDTAPWDAEDAVRAQEIMNAGAAGDLGNPDGLPGVNLHFDTGVNPTDPAHATLFGDWGGSGPVPEGVGYLDAADIHRSPVRSGLFRYGLGESSGGGQGTRPGDRFHWGAKDSAEANARLLLHELGHNLNLTHWGHDSGGKANCKPNYRSIMNYAFMYRTDNTFSDGTSGAGPLDPTFVSETIGLNGTADPAYLADADFHRLVNGPAVDWDFSGDFWRPVRAPLLFTTNEGPGGCSVSSFNTQPLTAGVVHASTPALARAFKRFYAFWITPNGQIAYRSAVPSGPDANGSCPGGDARGDSCMAWSEGGSVKTEETAEGLDAIGFDGGLLLAYRAPSGEIRALAARELVINDYPDWGREQVLRMAPAMREPELAVMHVDPRRFAGNNKAAGLFLLDGAGRYHWHTLTSLTGNWSSQGELDLRDGTGARVVGTQSPALESWPPFGVEPVTDPATCGVFTDADALLLYCYEPTSHRFELRTDAFRANQSVTAKPGFAFRILRESSGSPVRDNEYRGQFWLSTVDRNTTPRVLVSTTHDTVNHPRNARFENTRRALMGNKWTKLQAGTGVPLFSDLGTSALKGLYASDIENTRGLRFMPLADGTVQMILQDVNDFRVMQRGICLGLHGAFAEVFCGNAAGSLWGM